MQPSSFPPPGRYFGWWEGGMGIPSTPLATCRGAPLVLHQSFQKLHLPSSGAVCMAQPRSLPGDEQPYPALTSSENRRHWPEAREIKNRDKRIPKTTLTTRNKKIICGIEHLRRARYRLQSRPRQSFLFFSTTSQPAQRRLDHASGMSPPLKITTVKRTRKS